VKPLPTSIKEKETHWPEELCLLHQGEGRTSEDLEGDEPPPAPDQDHESNWIFQEHVS